MAGNCEYHCQWSRNRLDYNYSDAVIFHLYNNIDRRDFVLHQLPERKNSDQKWVLMAKEPPAFFYSDQLKLLNDEFNLTMTFLTDADVSIPLGHATRNLDRAFFSFEWNPKKKLIAWMASNCITSSIREPLVKELQKYINVDVFGACGDHGNGGGKKRDEFKEVLAGQYRFYLALENSDCDEYITEKFGRNLQLGMIPIVKGRRALYSKFAPPNSFFHADAFTSVETLAKYLERVASNPVELRQYHEWRSTYEVFHHSFTSNHNWPCDLCTEDTTLKEKP
ncbi:alpha-(1,3)-fucosyltransferase C-like [Watersipora subatra]|uniref:alpha-(1,3)-fucosyltransferase C-like n=1 Tax=Watersipora subatra TaxID=2589382 RepID=UPI00355C1D8A